MSKFGLTLGLIISVILHAWLFRYGLSPASADNTDQPDTSDIPVAAVDIAKIAEPPEPAKVEEVAVKETPVEPIKPIEPVEEVEPVKKQPEPPKVAQIPELVESGKKQITAQDQPGDFTGETDGVSDPVVRINWGNLKNAVAILETSGMKLVIYESGGSVKRQVNIEGSRVSIKPLRIEPTIKYSDSLRIVDKVPAFAPITRSLKISASDHLAVLVPVSVERIIESAKIAEVSRRSLSLRDVKVIGGKFNVTDGKVIFIIEKVLLRS